MQHVTPVLPFDHSTFPCCHDALGEECQLLQQITRYQVDRGQLCCCRHPQILHLITALILVATPLVKGTSCCSNTNCQWSVLPLL